MTVNKFFLLAVTGCVAAATAYALNHRAHREEAQRHKDDLDTWEGEGGKAAQAPASPFRAI